MDCGAFNGYTIDMFVKKFHNYKSIVAFEPQNDVIPVLEKRMVKHHDVYIIQKGVSDINGKLFFATNGESSMVVDADTGNSISVTRIDDCKECKDATFIKMDIEGSELAALHGAEGTIKRNRPKLAISIYHSDEDMLRIAEYIHDIVPEYKLYVRAHRPGIAETVLYAVA